MALILYFNGGYRTGFATLLIPALLCLGTLVLARLLHPRPHELEKGAGHTVTTPNLTQAYWIYLAAGGLLAAGFADFALIGFHFQKANVVRGNVIPVFYAVAMAASALASIPLGRLFDRFGPNVSLFAFLISAAAAPFVFLGTSVFALIGMIFWGIGMSAQGSLFQAMLTGVIPPEKRSTAFGLFDTGYGIAWFLGSAAMGLLYEKSEIDSGHGAVFSHPSTCSIASAFYREQEALDFSMDPYAKPKERKVGAQRPKITHLPKSIETRTRRERQAEKQAVAAERRAIKKSARRHLKRQLLEELKESE